MTRSTPPSGEATPAPPHRHVLESWKGIAAYLNRSVRTVRRWERNEGLPVHRHVHQKLGTVYAHMAEVDAWWESRRHAAGAHAPAASARQQNAHDSDRLMLAVLPFERLGSDAEQDYLSEGLTEDVIVELGRMHPARLGVIARTTVMRYKGTNRSVRTIGVELGVDFVLEGSVRREGDHVRVTARLIEVKDQAQRWAGSYEHTMRSILALQREIAGDIARGIRLNLPDRQQAALRETPSVDPQSYYAYLKGRHFLNGSTSESVSTSVEALRLAVALDPTNATAHAALAEAYEQLSVWTDVPSAEILPLATGAARSALALDPHLADAHASLGLIAANRLWDWPEAERCFERALALNPSCSSAAQWYAEFLAELGRTDRALAIVDQAVRHDPLSLVIHACRAFVLWLGRRFDEAIATAEHVLAMDPRYAKALIRLGVARAGKGQYDDAAHAFRLAREATPGLLDCTSLLGYAEARAGRRDHALAALDLLREEATRRYVPPFLLANVHLGLGDHDQAVTLIEEEWQRRGWYLLLIGRSPIYDPLRSNPRFQAVLGRMDFPA